MADFQNSSMQTEAKARSLTSATAVASIEVTTVNAPILLTEYLGVLARYRLTIEEADLRHREIWSNTARTWYSNTADLPSDIGRIRHRLAVSAGPSTVLQLLLYSKAPIVAVLSAATKKAPIFSSTICWFDERKPRL